ncbi:YbaB/EbfC family nucleoid-associated protein [Bacteroidota bacterium]
MLGDLFGKLQEAKKAMEESKKKLKELEVEATLENGKIHIVASGDKRIKSIRIEENFVNETDNEILQDFICKAVNLALEEAEKQGQKEIKEATKGMLPNIPGMF